MRWSYEYDLDTALSRELPSLAASRKYSDISFDLLVPCDTFFTARCVATKYNSLPENEDARIFMKGGCSVGSGLGQQVWTVTLFQSVVCYVAAWKT